MLPVAPHKEDIKAAIRKKGGNLRLLRSAAEKDSQIKIGYSTLTLCLDRPLPRANKLIADFLELSLHHLWPKWYDADGKRIPFRSPLKHSPNHRACRSKKSRRRLTKNGGAV